MYRIYADDVLIYDSTLEDFKIGKGQVTKETDKAGSFVFSLYPDHPYYDKFVQLRTVVRVHKSGKIVFRGRVLDDSTDYWNNKALTCEGELGFLQDSIVRPFTFTGTAEAAFRQFIAWHNSQVDDFKQFKVGSCTVAGSVTLVSAEYDSALNTLNTQLVEGIGGHLYITHGEDGTDPVPTIHYLADFTEVASQGIEFGVNLKNYAKKTSAQQIATAIIPLGPAVDDGDSDTEDPPLTIADVNGGLDYIYSEAAVALRGWVFKTVEFEAAVDAADLLARAQAYLDSVVNQTVTLELTAIDLHLLDRSIESYGVNMYIPATSAPHGLQMTLLCNKQTLDLLKPDNDTVTLGHTYATFTESSTKGVSGTIKRLESKVSSATATAKAASSAVVTIDERVTELEEGGGGTSFTTDETLTLDPDTKVLSVNRALAVEADNTLPVTSAAVYVEVGNIDALLQTI